MKYTVFTTATRANVSVTTDYTYHNEYYFNPETKVTQTQLLNEIGFKSIVDAEDAGYTFITDYYENTEEVSSLW